MTGSTTKRLDYGHLLPRKSVSPKGVDTSFKNNRGDVSADLPNSAQGKVQGRFSGFG